MKMEIKFVDLVITALKAYQKPKPTSGDVQKHIDVLENLWNHTTYNGSIIGLDRYGRTEEAQEAIDLVITALKAYQPWISVEDSLPEVYQYDNGEPMEFNVIIVDAEVPTTLCFNGKEWFEEYNPDRFFDITHWMPLPQPPKGEMQ